MSKLTFRTLFAAVAFATLASAQDFKVMSWKNDRWNSTDGIILKSDKLEHAVRDGLIFYSCRELNLSVKTSFILTTSVALAWEVRDGFKWKETDGASTKDLIAGVAGQIISHFAHSVITSKKSKHKEF